MAYATLGSIVFERLYSPNSLRVSDTEKYAVIPLASGKPTLQKIGSELRTIDFSIRLNRQFCDVQVELEKIRVARETAEVLMFTTGEGELLGDFVITQVSQNRSDLSNTGQLVNAECDISLLEYYNPDEQSKLESDAQEKAFANDARKVVPVLPAKQQLSSAAIVSANARGSKAEILGASDNLSKAAQGAQTTTKLQRAKQQVDAAKTKVNTVISSLQADVALALKAPQMLAAAQAAAAYIPDVLTAIISGNAQAALANCDALGVLLADMVTKGVNIETDLLKRIE